MFKKTQLTAALLCGLAVGAGGQQIVAQPSATARVFNLRVGVDGTLTVSVAVQPEKGLPFGREIVWKEGAAFLDGELVKGSFVDDLGKAAAAFRDVANKSENVLAKTLARP